jgi:hypothetical protein
MANRKTLQLERRKESFASPAQLPICRMHPLPPHNAPIRISFRFRSVDDMLGLNVHGDIPLTKAHAIKKRVCIPSSKNNSRSVPQTFCNILQSPIRRTPGSCTRL